MRGRRFRRDRGSVLIVALIVLFALAAMTLAMSHGARIDAAASANGAGAIQAGEIARGAERWLLSIIETEGAEAALRDESEFEQRSLGGGYFWVVRPDYGDPDLPECGLTDEAGKLNINAAAVESLRMLPGMSDEMAAAVVDWRDENEEAEANGAEAQYYLTLPQPYRAKNAPFEYVEELLLVRGFERPWLFGGATPEEISGLSSRGSSSSVAFSEQALQTGLLDYLTVFSVDPGLNNDGTETVNANIPNERDRLREAFAARLTQSRADEIVDTIGNNPLRDVFDLYFRAQMTPEEFRSIEDLFRTSNQVERPGMINVNTAPREVLLATEGLTEADVETLLAQRPSAVAAYPGTMTWVVEALGQRAIGLGERFVARSHQFTADIVAAPADGRAFRRIRVSIDATETPKIVYRRDVTHLGWPLDPQILASLRRGEAATGATMGSLR